MNVISHPNTINYCCNKPVTKYSQFLLYHFLLGIIKSIKPNKCQALNSSLRFCIPTATKTILHRTSPPDIHSYVQAIRSHVVNPTKKRSLTNFSFLHSEKFKEQNKENKAETYRNPSPERPSAILIPATCTTQHTCSIFFIGFIIRVFLSCWISYSALKSGKFSSAKEQSFESSKNSHKTLSWSSFGIFKFLFEIPKLRSIFCGVTVSKRKTNKLLRGWHTQKA